MADSAVSVFDGRAFFDKALLRGMQRGIISADKLAAIHADAPKGIVQIARYFGTEYLRPDLEKAKDRMVNMISLHLEIASQGDVERAAQMLQAHSLLSRSKAGADMLKSLIAMPQNSHFGMNERGGFTDEQIPLLAKWSLRSSADYRAELASRSQVAQVTDAAIWIAGELGLEDDALEEAGADAEAVMRTALLTLAAKRSELPSWVAFDKMLVAMRAKAQAPTLKLPAKTPAQFVAVLESARQSVLADWPLIAASKASNRQLFDKSPALIGRYFWLEDALAAVDNYERQVSAAWQRLTGGHEDEGALLTLLVCKAAGSPPKSLLTEKSAAALIRKIRKSGWQPALSAQFIAEHAPTAHRSDFAKLWTSFAQEAEPILRSDADYQLYDALALLRRECHVAQSG